jgi:hypothetical protein
MIKKLNYYTHRSYAADPGRPQQPKYSSAAAAAAAVAPPPHHHHQQQQSRQVKYIIQYFPFFKESITGISS